jgi:hypothetical protein
MAAGRTLHHQRATWGLLTIALLATTTSSHAQIFQRHYPLRVQSLWSGYTVLGLSVDSNAGIAIAGGTGNTPQTQNAFLLKLDGSGTPLFHRDYSFNEADGIAASPDGGYFIVGHRFFNDDPLVFKTDANGNVIWARSLQMGFIEQGFWGIGAMPDGGCVASGIYTVRLDAAGTVQWSKFHHVVGFGVSADGDSTVIGGIGPDVPAAQDFNFGISKLDPDGHVVWSRSYGHHQTERAYFFTAVPGGGYILAGNFLAGSGPPRAMLLKVTADGAPLWARVYTPTTGSSLAHGVVGTPDGGAVFTGQAAGRIMLARVDAGGTLQWSWSYDVGAGYSLASMPNGGYVLAGVSSGQDLVVIRTDAFGRSGCETELPLSLQGAVGAGFDLGAEIPQNYTPRVESPSVTSRELSWTATCAPVATRLESFVVVPQEEGLEVRWRWSDAANPPVTVLERSSRADDDWRAIPSGHRTDDGWWLVLDRDVEPDRNYSYRLMEELADGSQQILGVVTQQMSATSQPSLGIRGGSPSVGSASIQYSLTRSGPIEIQIVDVRGRRVATLVNGWKSRGSSECTWDGSGGGGRRAAAGVYFVTLRTSSQRLSRQLVFLP